jgi:hypothetical protein
MQEDNLEKRLADSLRRQQEENPLPYEVGAWEAFDKKRAALARKRTFYWVSGIAASLILLLVAGSIWLDRQGDSSESSFSNPIALEENPSLTDSTNSQEALPDTQATEANPTQEESEKTQIAPNSSRFLKPSRTVAQGSGLGSKAVQLPSAPESQESASMTVAAAIPSSSQASGQEVIAPAVAQGALANSSEDSKATLPKEPLLTEEEIQDLLSEEKTGLNLALGVSPGFGTTQGAQLATSGSSLGLGVMVDTKLGGKLSVGSGLGVNYLNQASESQSYAQVAGFSSPVTQTDEISQVQVDIPLYVRYPITQSQSVSIQAGFSNLLTFNQAAEQETSYIQQVPVQDAITNSLTLKSQEVNQVSDLVVTDRRFYPFATANFGVNVRLYQSKKTSYEVMPFYNYPLQEFSGYGEKLGMFGASFRVNFGAVQRK